MNLQKNQKIVLGISGIAAISGAVYYLLRKWKNKSISYSQKYQQFCQKFYTCSQIDLYKMQDRFDELFRDRLKNVINFEEIDAQLEKQHGLNNSEIKQKVCRKKLSGLYYYECLDCSIQKGILKEINKEFHDSFDYYSFCEECFDKEYHKGHKFKIKQGKNNVFCDCGSQFLGETSSFCKQHCGYSECEKQYNEYTEQYKKDQVILFFQEFLFLLFDGIRKEIESQNTIMKKIDSTRHNALFTFIVDKMKEIIKHYDPFIFSINELLQQPLMKDIPILPFQQLIKQKNFEQPETILDWLFVFNQISTESNEAELSWVVEEIAFSSMDFLLFYAKGFFKNFQMVLKREVYTDSNHKKYYFINILSTYRITLYPLSREDFFNEIIQTNIENVLYPLKNLVLYISEDTEGIRGIHSENILTYFFQYLIFLVQNVSTIKIIKGKLKKLTSIICDLSFNFILKLTFSFNNSGMQDFSFFEKLIEFKTYQQYEISLLRAIKYYIYSLCQLDDEDLKQEVIQKFAKRYNNGIDNIYSLISSLKARDEKQNIFYFGVSFISLIIYIITLNQRKSFSQQVIRQGICQSFQITEEPQLLLFICKVQYILRHFFLSFNENGLSGFLNTSSNFQAEFPEIAQSMPIFIERMISSCYGIYDHYILTLQIFNLADTDSLLHTSIFFENINFFLQSNEINKFQSMNFLIYQVLFDQTPFVNIFIGKHQEIFLDYAENIQKPLNKIINQTVLDIIIQNNDHSKPMLMPLLEQKLEKFISFIMYFKDQLLQIGSLNPEDNHFHLNPQQSLTKTLVNQCRSFYQLDTHVKFYEYHNSFCNFILNQDQFLSNQLILQREILFDVFLNPKLNEQLLQLLKLKPNLISFPTIQTYLCIIIELMHYSASNKSDLSIYQHQDSNIVRQMYSEKNTFESILSLLNNAISQPKMYQESYQIPLIKQSIQRFNSLNQLS